MIRLGANVDATDQLGVTSLFHAVVTLTAQDLDTGEPLLYPVPKSSNQHPSTGPMLKMVIALLIEQHAHVNVVWKNATCCTMLMRAKYKHWDLIEPLIAHGALEDLGSLNGLVLSKVEKKRISELLRTRPSKRPPRPCPCFSGRLLTDCHGKRPRPLPCHFICPCQSGSVYGSAARNEISLGWKFGMLSEEFLNRGAKICLCIFHCRRTMPHFYRGSERSTGSHYR
ncbi:hypothetical protein BD410DRAFT_786330 [Rickenella mellea]|uniref:Ankyrin n=1 Tax=Rickenella mellea TaxID=50990 RepID=A0A4Y7Q989_9AGAM|nr:hypothetical protein BD410DRAFT_786330 [Rickenella mellea]